MPDRSFDRVEVTCRVEDIEAVLEALDPRGVFERLQEVGVGGHEFMRVERPVPKRRFTPAAIEGMRQSLHFIRGGCLPDRRNFGAHACAVGQHSTACVIGSPLPREAFRWKAPCGPMMERKR